MEQKMLKQIICIGPLKISLAAEDAMASLLCGHAFEQPAVPVRGSYFAQALFVPSIIPAGDILYSGNGLEVRGVQNSPAEHRYSYREIDGEKQYFAHYSLENDQIQIELLKGLSLAQGAPFELWRFLFLEQLLLEHDALILHSASVVHQREAVLFTAPSGTGKSTQAELWKNTLPDCAGLNGDRNLLLRQDGRWVVSGLPWHGSSADCRNLQCPVRAIAYIRRDKSDFVQPLSPLEQVTLLYSEVTVNRWKPENVNRVFDLLGDLSKTVPVVALHCTPTPQAVMRLKSFLEGPNDGSL